MTVRWNRRAWARLSACAASAVFFFASGAAAEPLRLDDMLGLPDSLSLSFQQRTRYEYLSEQFRTARPGEDEVFVLRTLLHGRWSPTENLTFGAELQDSRGYEVGNGNGAPGDDVTPFNQTIVNALELLQGYVEYRGEYAGGGGYFAKLGRLTMDVGSRRLVARNRYRNTINAFTGLETGWKNEEGDGLRAFFVLPIQRRPSDAISVEDNDVKLDDERFDVRFWGLFYETNLPLFDGKDRLELYFFGLNESDSSGRQTRNRDIYTPGFRVLRKPAAERFDFHIENAFQFGESRVSSGATENLDHLAHFHHFEFGYTLDLPWSPRVVLAYDYASGDDDPNDGDNNRFDTLFGARRWEFGPTSVFGPFARSNLNTPGVFLHTKPRTNLATMLAVRGHWLASDTDAWPAAGVRDPTGATSSYVGTLIDFRIRYDVFPGNLRIETGYTHLFAGSFAENAPGGLGEDSDYFYLQTAFRL